MHTPMQRTEAAYTTLANISQQIAAPQAFTDDLHRHDRLTLATTNWDHFLWLVWSSGTRLIVMQGDYWVDEDTTPHVQILDTYQPSRIFWYYAGSVRELIKAEAKEVLNANAAGKQRLWQYLKARSLFLEQPHGDQDDQRQDDQRHDDHQQTEPQAAAAGSGHGHADHPGQ